MSKLLRGILKEQYNKDITLDIDLIGFISISMGASKIQCCDYMRKLHGIDSGIVINRGDFLASRGFIKQTNLSYLPVDGDTSKEAAEISEGNFLRYLNGE